MECLINRQLLNLELGSRRDIFKSSFNAMEITLPFIKIRFADDTATIAKTQEEQQDMVNRLVDTGRKYGIINIDKSQVMRVSRNNESCKLK